MQDSVRILIVEHRYRDRLLARQLLEDYGIEFNWISVACGDELRELATQFDPTIVMCADDSTGWRNAALGTLRILSTRTPVIMVSEIDADAEPLYRALSTRDNDSARVAAYRTHSVPTPVMQLRRVQSLDDISTRTPHGLPNMLEASDRPLVMTDAKGWISYANTAACRALAGMRDELLVTLIDSGYSQCPNTANWLNPVNERVEERDCLRPMPSEGEQHVPRPHRLAYVDPLTRLPALAHLHDLIRRLTDKVSGAQTAMPLLSVNLDGMRALHDAYGRSRGDDVVARVNELMQSAQTPYGSVARVGADDFLVALPALCNPADAAATADRILESLIKPPQTAEHDIFSSAHPVLAAYAAASDGVPTLFRSDSAENIERELDDTMQRQALSLHYQPQFDIRTGRGCGMEALVRWHLSNGDVIAPSVFIPVAERSGMIRKLGGWVLRSACDSTSPWCSRDHTGLTLSVNVSALQIDAQFTDHLRNVLAHTGFPAARLELEITESALIRNVESTLLCLTEWKRLGVRIAVDDFGTGYSNLSYLSRLPLDRLKLDRSLVDMMSTDKKGAAVMRTMISLGAELGITVVAEGVETETQLKMLQDFGCPQAQGYLLARPMPAKQAQVVLRKQWGNRAVTTARAADAGVRYAS